MGKRTKEITLQIGEDKELTFTVTLTDHERFINNVTNTKKTAPMKDLLRATVKPEDKEQLDVLINDGLTVDLASALIEEYQPKVAVTVKK